MSARRWHGVPKDLAGGALVLSRAGSRRGWLLWCALVVMALAAGAALGYGYARDRYARAQEASVPLRDMQQLGQQLEQARLQLRVSDGRSQELERQIDTLNQRLRESQEELVFFRKTRDAKH